MKKGILAILVIGLLVLAFVGIALLFEYYSSFLPPRPVTDKMLLEGFSRAVSAPNESIVSENLKLLDGAAYSVRSFASNVNIEENCVEIQASDSNAFTVHQGKVIQVNDLIQTNVYYKCVLGATAGVEECPLFCTVSFGKELP